MTRQSFFLLICLFIFMGIPSGARAGVLSTDLKAALTSLAPEGEIRIIVKFFDGSDSIGRQRLGVSGLSSDNVAAGSRSSIGSSRRLRRRSIIHTLKERASHSRDQFKTFLKNRRISRKKSLWIINGMALTASADVIREIATHPLVESVRTDRIIPLSDTVSTAAAVPEWNLDAIGAGDLWALGHTGQGVVVANMDTGVDGAHPDLISRWRGGTNSWFDPNGVHDTPYDSSGHGTQTMGLILGGDAGGTGIGVAPDARWIAVKIFDDAGNSSVSLIHQGFQWLLDPDGDPNTDDAPDIVNNSWELEDQVDQCNGVNGYVNPFLADIQALREAEIVVVFSAGNAGPLFSTSLSPGNNPDVLSVGSVDSSLVIESSSSRGPSACGGGIFPHVVAPGAGVRTADLSFGGMDGRYITVFGTSFSAAHASGIAALLLSAFSNATVVQLEEAIKNGAIDLGDLGPDNVYGNGLIDGSGAFNAFSTGGSTSCVRPLIDFSVSPHPCVIGEPVTFTSTVSGGIPPYTYAWDVDGDGLTDFDTPSPTHTYTADYQGTVSLVVTDSVGCSASLSITDAWIQCPPLRLCSALPPIRPWSENRFLLPAPFRAASFHWSLPGILTKTGIMIPSMPRMFMPTGCLLTARLNLWSQTARDARVPGLRP